jgi:hypothetical protein
MFTDDKLALLKQAKVREGLCIVHKEDTMIWTFFIFNSNKDNGLDVIVIFKKPGHSRLNQGFFTNGNRNLYRGYHSYRWGAIIKTDV